MQDRIPTYPGRVMLVPVEGSDNTFDMTLADIPIKTGTALNKNNLLKDSTAALVNLDEDATPNDALVAIIRRLVATETALGAAGANASAITSIQTKLNGLIKYGTTDMTPGVSDLTTGSLYVMYK